MKLTEKELFMIKNQLTQEKQLIEIYKTYSEICNDPEIRLKCESLIGKHQTHYDKLFGLLN